MAKATTIHRAIADGPIKNDAMAQPATKAVIGPESISKFDAEIMVSSPLLTGFVKGLSGADEWTVPVDNLRIRQLSRFQVAGIFGEDTNKTEPTLLNCFDIFTGSFRNCF